MKKYIYAMLAAPFLLIMGCKDTNVNLVQDRDGAVVPTLSDPNPAYFTDNIPDSYVQFDLSLPQSQTIDKAQIQVSRITAGRDTITAIVGDVTIPSTGVKVTASDVIKALNISESDYKLGDIFNLYILTTKNGITTRSIAAFSIPVNCYFDPSMLVGAFDYSSDANNWNETGSINLVADPANPYKIYIADYAQAEGLTGNGNRIELDINPNNFSISGPKVIISNDLSEWGLSYHNYAYQPISGKYSACNDAYTITFAIDVKEGSFGNNVFTFTRKK